MAKPYHHGDLREGLINAAVIRVREQGPESLTVRGLAAALDVSPSAAYHHFPDKLALIGALATEGYEIWMQRARRAVAAKSSPEAQLAALAHGWLRFAATYPSHYRVMFLPDLEDRERFASLHAVSGAGLALLLGVLARGMPTASPELVKARAIVAWSTLHGFASLRSAGVLGNIPSLPGIRRLEQEAVQQVIAAAFVTAEHGNGFSAEQAGVR